MADVRREEQTRNATRETRGKNDVTRTPEMQHEIGRSGKTSDLTRRDLGRDPFAMMTSLRREMDRLFDDFGFGGSLFRGPRLAGELDRNLGNFGGNFGGHLWSPRVETFERDGKLHVSADLPGLSKDDVRIEVLENNLTIEGERRHEQRDEREGWSERSYGHFFRSIPLPEGINPDTAKASFNDGVLEIVLDAPKIQQRRGKQIQIGGGKG